jgi:catechol 2,3-dioxygenase-like lactoylglutathione lyase family enzyme
MPAPLPIRGLHHIALVSHRLEETLAFYRDVLGFRELSRPPFRFRGAWLYHGGLQIHLIEGGGAPPPAADAAIDTRAEHLAFSVPELAGVTTILRERGIVYREQVNAGGIRQVFFRDPDGHHVELAVHGDPTVGHVEVPPAAG